jgi:sphinganine-1-phosphate aldolase
MCLICSLQLVDVLIKDLSEVSEELVSSPEIAKSMSGGSAPMYGMANVVPDRRMVAEFLVAYQDVMLEP